MARTTIWRSARFAIWRNRHRRPRSTHLVKATSSGSAYRQQQAWKLAAEIPGAETLIVSGLTELQKQNGISPAALELLDAAGKRSEPEVKAALAAFQSAQSSSADPLAAWLPSLEGGDPEKEPRYSSPIRPASACAATRAATAAVMPGPNLSDVGLREDRRYFLESLIIPGAKVAMGYGIASATLKGGKTVGGIVIDDKPDHVDFDSAGTRPAGLPRRHREHDAAGFLDAADEFPALRRGNPRCDRLALRTENQSPQ